MKKYALPEPMQLYTREVSPKGKITYQPYPPTVDIGMELDNGEVITLLTTLYMCVVMSITKFLPPHARIHRLAKDCETVLLKLSHSHRAPLDDHLVAVGEAGFTAYVEAICAGVQQGRKASTLP